MNKVLSAALASAALGLAGGLSCCIARGSRVQTPRGLRAIETLEADDQVVVVDPESGEVFEAPLVATRSAIRETIVLRGDGFSLRCTTDHPLWDPDGAVWADAGDWALGRRRALLFVDEARRVRRVEVTERTLDGGVIEVFDLSVDHPVHTFVAEGVVVHNKPPLRPPGACNDSGDQRRACACGGTELGTVCVPLFGGVVNRPCDCTPDCTTADGQAIVDGRCTCPTWDHRLPNEELGSATCGGACQCGSSPFVSKCLTPSGDVLASADGGRFPPVVVGCGCGRELGLYECSDPGSAPRHVTALCNCRPDCALPDGGPVIERLAEPCRCVVDGGTAQRTLRCESTADGGRVGGCDCADAGP
jgi:hypothetical protein